MDRFQKETDSDNAAHPTDEDSEVEQTIRLNPSHTSPPKDVEEMELKKIPVKETDVGFPVIIGRPTRCCKVEHLRYAVFVLNLILSILGFAIIALAVWIRVDPDFWQYNTSLEMGNFYIACYLFMVSGLVILIVGFLGCCGALNEVQWMLITYMVISFIFFAVEVVAVILIWYAPFSTAIRGALETALRENVDRRTEDDASRYFIDYVQVHLECCGSTDPQDYFSAAPPSCVNPETGNLFEKGCAETMLSYVRTKAGIVGGIAVPILLLHLISLFVTFAVLRDIRVESRYSI